MIQAEKANYPVVMMCSLLGVSRSGFYAWQVRPRSRRKLEDEELLERIRDVFIRSRGTYGSPRVHAELRAEGLKVGHNRVARLMRENGLQARRRKRFRRTTDSTHDLPVAENILDRNFDVDRPDTVWAADLTYIRTHEGWLYLAVVMDLYSRRVVGWSMNNNMDTGLMLRAFQMALGRRQPVQGLIHHSDRGSQYASAEYQQALFQAGMVCSMSRKGDCWDNAVVESFFATLEMELIEHCSWPTRRAARTAIHEYIEVFYNRRRRHSYLGYVSPAQYEAMTEVVSEVAV